MANLNYSKAMSKLNKLQYNLKAKMTTSDSSNFSDFKRDLNLNEITYYPGIINNLYVITDTVFAVIEKNYPPRGENILYDHGDGFFNVKLGAPAPYVVQELIIPTNIDPMTANLRRYLRRDCTVKVRNNVAIFADVVIDPLPFSNFTPTFLSFVRSNTSNGDLFSEEAMVIFKKYGYTEEEVKELKNLKYDELEHANKIISFKGDSSWFKDTSLPEDYELVLEPTPDLVGLNKSPGKNKKCHIAIKFLSGK